jgi:hypothetical protein
MTLVAERTVLTQQAEELSMEPGVGNHWMLVWSRPGPLEPITTLNGWCQLKRLLGCAGCLLNFQHNRASQIREM